MSVLDHWNPVVRSRDLRRRPVKVRVDGQDIALFRAASGAVGALDDCCLHRRMSLSRGCVVGDRLRCQYHGWTFDCDGAGESPGTPKMRAQAQSYEAREEHGFVWIRRRGSSAEFPKFDVAGHYPLGVLQHTVQAPLELVVDNFCEIEHTPTTHALFGYELARMSEVETHVEVNDRTVRVTNFGPQKPIIWPLRVLLGVSRRGHFIDEWTTHFSPCYSVYDHSWHDPQTGRDSRLRWRVYVFFTPVDVDVTALSTFAFTRSSYPGPYGGVRLVKPIMKRFFDHELRLDVRTLESLADKNPSIEGMKLSRFDRVLSLNRERIDRIYRGRAAG